MSAPDAARRMRLVCADVVYDAEDVRMHYETRTDPGDEEKGIAPFTYQTGRAFVDVTVREPTFALLDVCTHPPEGFSARIDATVIDLKGRSWDYVWTGLEPVGFHAPVPSREAVIRFVCPDGGFTDPRRKVSWN